VDDDPLPERLAVVLARQVVVMRADSAVPQRRPGQLGADAREVMRSRRGARSRVDL
jgi:hypothetical protein